MFRTETSNLPAEQKQQLHADFLANEQAYLHMRDALLPRHIDKTARNTDFFPISH